MLLDKSEHHLIEESHPATPASRVALAGAAALEVSRSTSRICGGSLLRLSVARARHVSLVGHGPSEELAEPCQARPGPRRHVRTGSPRGTSVRRTVPKVSRLGMIGTC